MAIIERDEDGIITGLNLFGFNFAQVVCFKTTGLVSFAVMIPSCIGYIYWTGKTRKLLEVAFISYWGTYWPFFVGCRYFYYRQQFSMDQAMRLHVDFNLKKGTAEDPRLKYKDMKEYMKSFTED